jgi:CDP-diacylglycerol--serine O-phosphatidyltransferase
LKLGVIEGLKNMSEEKQASSGDAAVQGGDPDRGSADREDNALANLGEGAVQESTGDASAAMKEDSLETLLPIDEHEEIVSEGGKTIIRRGIFLLPNLLTLGAMFSGFYAIIAGMAGDFNEAGWAIFIAGVLDGLDGRIARLTNTQSAFGAQFDSLSDLVSFGVAPSLIMFSWAFEDIGRFGWAASFIYMSCAALRLARFNVQLGTADKRFFVGLQSPLAAAVITFIPWVGHKYEVAMTQPLAIGLAIATVFIRNADDFQLPLYQLQRNRFQRHGSLPLLCCGGRSC